MVAVDAEALAIQRCQAGDSEAFAVLVQAYQRQVFGLAYRLLNDRAEAEDIAQEAFLRSYRSLGTFQSGQPFGPWIYRIATNIALDRLRKRKHEALHPGDEREREIADSTPGPEEETIRRDTRGRLSAAVDALAPEYRIPVVLFHLQGLPIETVARVTGLPLTVIKNRLYRARKMLREVLRDRDNEPDERRCSDEQMPVRNPVGSLR